MMGKKFCPRCGKEVEKLYDGLCLKCYIETHQILPKKIALKRCKICGSYYVGKRAFKSEESAVEMLIKKHLKEKFDNVYFRIYNNQLILHIGNEEIVSEIEVEEFVCDMCKKKMKEVAILQLRGESKKIKDVLNEIENLVSSSRDKTLSIKKLEEVKNGYDVYLSSRGGARRIVGLIKNKYNVEIKTSRKLVGLKEGKRVYKDFILVRVTE